jgi:hypothetical protein
MALNRAQLLTECPGERGGADVRGIPRPSAGAVRMAGAALRARPAAGGLPEQEREEIAS